MNKTVIAYICQATAWFLWSMDPILIRMIGDDVPRPIMCGMSFFMAGLVLFPSTCKGFVNLFKHKTLLFNFVFYILIASTTAELMYVYAIKNLNPGLVSLILRSQIILTILSAWIFFSERINKTVVFGIIVVVLGYLGMAYFNGEATANSGRNALYGWIFAILAAIFWTSGTILGKKLLKTIPAAQLAGMRMFTSGLIPLLFYLCTIGMKPYLDITGGQWLLFLLKGILCSALTFYLYMKGLHLTSVTASAAMEQVAPLFTLAVAALLLHESISAWQWLFVSVVFIGAAIILHNQYKTTK